VQADADHQVIRHHDPQVHAAVLAVDKGDHVGLID
jgi:hypothetical protein